MIECIDRVKLNEVADVLERMAEAVRETASGNIAFTRACGNHGLNWKACWSLMQTKTFEKCGIPQMVRLKDVVIIEPDPYEKLYLAVFPEIDRDQTDLPFDYRESAIAALGTLSERQRDITCKECGIDEPRGEMTHDEIAKDYGLTRERIRQIYRQALRKLRAGPTGKLLVRGLCQTLADKAVEEAGKEAARDAIRRHREELIRGAKERAEREVEASAAKSLETPIEDLELSVRSYNCLSSANILTLRDLMKLTDEELMEIRNLGWNSFKEIKAKKAEAMEEMRRG